MSITDVKLVQAIYTPPDLKRTAEAEALQQIAEDMKNDAANQILMEEQINGTIGLAIVGFYGFWVVLSLCTILVAQLRWCRQKQSNFSDKFQVQSMLLISMVLHASAVALFFIDLKMQLLLGLTLLSNLSFFWSILFVLGESKKREKKIDSSFARIRTIILFCGFGQIVVFASSFSAGTAGGECSKERVIPYVFDALYGLQVLAILVIWFEKFFGFGKEPKEEGIDDTDQIAAVKKQVNGTKTRGKLVMMETRKERIGEQLFRDMTYFAYIFIPIILILKLGILLGNRLYVVTLLESEGKVPMLYCNVDGSILRFVDEMGLAYVAVFALQLIIGAEQLRVTLYEGALGSKILSPTIASTMCSSFITCCKYTPANVQDKEEDGAEMGKLGGDNEAATADRPNESRMHLTGDDGKGKAPVKMLGEDDDD